MHRYRARAAVLWCYTCASSTRVCVAAQGQTLIDGLPWCFWHRSPRSTARAFLTTTRWRRRRSAARTRSCSLCRAHGAWRGARAHVCWFCARAYCANRRTAWVRAHARGGLKRDARRGAQGGLRRALRGTRRAQRTQTCAAARERQARQAPRPPSSESAQSPSMGCTCSGACLGYAQHRRRPLLRGC